MMQACEADANDQQHWGTQGKTTGEYIEAYHLVHEAAAFYLKDVSISILQDVKAVNGLDGVGVWVP